MINILYNFYSIYIISHIIPHTKYIFPFLIVLCLIYFKSKCKDKKGKFKIDGETKKLNCNKIEKKGLCSDGKSKEGKPLKELCPKK